VVSDQQLPGVSVAPGYRSRAPGLKVFGCQLAAGPVADVVGSINLLESA
jgi:hypothetical protein